MKYDLTPTEKQNLITFLDKKIDECRFNSGYFDRPFPSWFKRVEILLDKLKTSNSLRINLSKYDLRELWFIPNLDKELPELGSFIELELKHLVSIGKLKIVLG